MIQQPGIKQGDRIKGFTLKGTEQLMRKLSKSIRYAVQIIKVSSEEDMALVKIHRFKQAGKSAKTYYLELYHLRFYGSKINSFGDGMVLPENHGRAVEGDVLYQKLEEYRKKKEFGDTEQYYYKDDKVVKAE